jgi:hypothetical protein
MYHIFLRYLRDYQEPPKVGFIKPHLASMETRSEVIEWVENSQLSHTSFSVYYADPDGALKYIPLTTQIVFND